MSPRWATLPPPLLSSFHADHHQAAITTWRFRAVRGYNTLITCVYPCMCMSASAMVMVMVKSKSELQDEDVDIN